METTREPRLDLAQRILPVPLYQALRHVFSRTGEGCALVGGTALAGFYAGHRRSDDIDIFTRSPEEMESAILAVKSLTGIGALLEHERRTPSYYRAVCRLDGHAFTADAVLDPRIFEVGRFVRLSGGPFIADLETLFMLKSAALVSRCAEKDLFDLIWIFGGLPGAGAAKLAQMGQRLDAGATTEGLLISLCGAALSAEACDFSLEGLAPHVVLDMVESFRQNLIRSLVQIAKDQPLPSLAELIQRARRLAG